MRKNDLTSKSISTTEEIKSTEKHNRKKPVPLSETNATDNGGDNVIFGDDDDGEGVLGTQGEQDNDEAAGNGPMDNEVDIDDQDDGDDDADSSDGENLLDEDPILEEEDERA